MKVEGLNHLVFKETPPWLVWTGLENISKLGPLDWLKLTPNSKIFHSKAFIKQDFVEMIKRICSVIKISSTITNTKIKAKKINQRLWGMVIISSSL